MRHSSAVCTSTQEGWKLHKGCQKYTNLIFAIPIAVCIVCVEILKVPKESAVYIQRAVCTVHGLWLQNSTIYRTYIINSAELETTPNKCADWDVRGILWIVCRSPSLIPVSLISLSFVYIIYSYISYPKLKLSFSKCLSLFITVCYYN